MSDLDEIRSPFLRKVLDAVLMMTKSQASSLWNAISGSRSPLTQSLR